MQRGEHWNVLDCDARKQPHTQFTMPDALKAVSLNEIMRPHMLDLVRADKEANYMLVSEEGAITGFHQDFSSTSVCYVVLKGCKTFYLVHPTPENQELLDSYVHHELRDTFFGAHPALTGFGCQSVTLKARQAVCMPAGMIHFVETTGTSIAIGKRFPIRTHHKDMSCRTMYFAMILLEQRLNAVPG